MSKIKTAEIFYSIQGEGRWAGVPSVFFRTFGCNFQCRGFGLPLGERSDEPERIANQLSKYDSYDSLPLAPTGCDSYASWHPKFKKFSPTLTIDEIAKRFVDIIPNGKWTQDNGRDIHLVITGGEPLLGWQKSYIQLLQHPLLADLKNVTFETNTTQKITKELATFFETQSNIHVTWSCSPKLSISGEAWEEAIQPDIARSYYNMVSGGGSSFYLKFVVSNMHDLDDVRRAVSLYQAAGVHCPVYLMPVGGTVDSYFLNARQVAELAMQEGWWYSPRLQCDLFKNAWGT